MTVLRGYKGREASLRRGEAIYHLGYTGRHMGGIYTILGYTGRHMGGIYHPRVYREA